MDCFDSQLKPEGPAEINGQELISDLPGSSERGDEALREPAVQSCCIINLSH